MSVGTTDAPTADFALDVNGKGIFQDDVLVDGILKNQEGSSYFDSNFSAGKSYIRGSDDTGTQKYILRTYDIVGIQLALDAGGIEAAGDIISTGKVVAYSDT